MDVFIAQTASTMGNDGFRVLRIAFVGRARSQAFLEPCSAIPSSPERSIAFVKSHATLVREAGIFAQRGAKVTYAGDLVDGVVLHGRPPPTPSP